MPRRNKKIKTDTSKTASELLTELKDKEKQNNYVSYRVDNKTTRLILIAKAKKLKLI